MTREQARAILAHLDLIRHYADGGEVGLRLPSKTVRLKHICLSNLRVDGTNVVRVKSRYVFNKTLGMPEHKPWCFTEAIPETHIIKENQ